MAWAPLPQVIDAQNYQDYQTWSLPHGAIARLGKGRVKYIAFSPDGSRLAVVTFIGAWLYDVKTGRERALLTGHTGAFAFIAFSPDGTKIASTGDAHKAVQLWDVATGRDLATLKGHTGTINSIAFSPDSTKIASGAREVILWDTATGKQIATLIEQRDYSRRWCFHPMAPSSYQG